MSETSKLGREVGILLFNGVSGANVATLIETFRVLSQYDVVLIGGGADEIRSSSGHVEFQVRYTLNDAPALSALCVPNGFESEAGARDDAVPAFVAQQRRSGCVIGAIGGGLGALGAAGLLKGRTVAADEKDRRRLDPWGATPAATVVAADDGIVTAASGATAAAEVAVAVVAALEGADVATRLRSEIGLPRNSAPKKLTLVPNCQLCDADLPPGSPDARICSYECTFCATCVEHVLFDVCPNCGGNFQPRPIRAAAEWRPDAGLGRHPASDVRIHMYRDPVDVADFVARLRGIPPRDR